MHEVLVWTTCHNKELKNQMHTQAWALAIVLYYNNCQGKKKVCNCFEWVRTSIYTVNRYPNVFIMLSISTYKETCKFWCTHFLSYFIPIYNYLFKCSFILIITLFNPPTFPFTSSKWSTNYFFLKILLSFSIFLFFKN